MEASFINLEVLDMSFSQFFLRGFGEKLARAFEVLR